MAESFVEDLVNDMTFDEFKEWCIDDYRLNNWLATMNEKPLCSFKAYVGC